MKRRLPDGKQTMTPRLAQFQDPLTSEYECGTSISVQDFHAEVTRGAKCFSGKSQTPAAKEPQQQDPPTAEMIAAQQKL
jgi:hypothetical protein